MSGGAQAPSDLLYVEARRVLLDALEGLGPHRSAVVLVGAQAVYLRTARSVFATAPFTADGDLVLDPARLEGEPALEAAMTGAGFHLQQIDGHTEPGIWLASAMIAGKAIEVPVDLIVPDGVAPPGGRRGARLGIHGKRAARRIPGLEAALVDRHAMTVAALDPADRRTCTVNVAGPAALLIAKAHKLGERSERSGRQDRLKGKDAEDVLRLIESTDPAEVAVTFARLREDRIAGESTVGGLRYLEDLFGRRGGTGIELAVRALRGVTDAEAIEVRSLAYLRSLVEAL